MSASHDVVGLDIGATKTLAARLASDGRLLQEARMPTPTTDDPEALADALAALVEPVRGEARALGVGAPGQVEPLTGRVTGLLNLPVGTLELGAHLTERLALPVHVLNDTQAATYGEWQHGAARGAEHVLGLFVGTGVGGGLVSEDQLVRGATGTAGHVGHLIVEPDGPACSCGHRGCLEALCSGWAIARAAEAPDAQTVAERAEAGDSQARAVLERACQALARGVTGLVNVLDPDVVVLGGGVIGGQPWMVEQVSQAVAEHALASPAGHARVVAAELGACAGVVGAGAWALAQQRG